MRDGGTNGNWRGGRRNTKGYVSVLMPDHPRATRGYVLEHLLVAERALGHALPERAVVHHVNDVRHENGDDNLVICEDQAYHMLIHARRRIVRLGGDPRREKVCGTCSALKSRAAFHAAPSQPDGLYARCRECHAAAARDYRAAQRRSP